MKSGPSPTLSQQQVNHIRTLRKEGAKLRQIQQAVLRAYNIELSLKTISHYVNNPYKEGY